MSKAKPPTVMNRRPNYVYTVVSVALVLLLLGIFGLWLLQATHLSKTLKEEIDILTELRSETPEAERKQLMATLGSYSFVRAGSVSYRTKEQALTEMGAEVAKDLVDLDLPNPFRDMVIFNVREDYLQADSLALIAGMVKENPIVLDVYYQETFIDRVVENANKLAYVFVGMAVLLVLIAVVLIHNTVRLSLYSNRFLIKTQELVGASWSFISRPYLRRAFWHGLLSGLLAVGGLVGIQYWLQNQAPELRLFEKMDWLLILYGGMLLLGILISYVSHYSVVRRYLRLRVDDLY
jgi:cell division transport system permease protein